MTSWQQTGVVDFGDTYIVPQKSRNFGDNRYLSPLLAKPEPVRFHCENLAEPEASEEAHMVDKRQIVAGDRFEHQVALQERDKPGLPCFLQFAGGKLLGRISEDSSVRMLASRY